MIGFLISCLFLAVSLYLEYYKGLEPCPFCLLQRYILATLIAVFLIAIVRAKTLFQQQAYGLLTSLIALLGVVVALRHLWLQAHPQNVATQVCAPLSYLFKQLAFVEAFKTLVVGGSTCAEVNWQFLNLTIPGWALLGFLLLFCLSLFQIIRK